MKTTVIKLSLLALATAATACEFHARGPEDYRDATQAVLDTKTQDIKACYDAALKGQAELQGRVTVQFVVEAETGRIKDVKVDPAGTTAPEVLSQCVTGAISGLALTPPDKRDGIATFVYDFSSAGAAAAPPPAG
ncbi:MAG TPA: AgmX/PglI C-terminal domain-containing protein [Polyangiaceae bacterium]